MMSVEQALQEDTTAQNLAQAVLAEYFSEKQVTYPINPFQILTDYGVPFVFRAFTDKKYEGVYLPAQNDEDIAIVGINMKRPITRQRYTAAHELCHHIKDSKSSQVCGIGSQSPIEKYAENFAAELLMPVREMKRQIQARAPEGFLRFDDVLSISEYFGVSFLSCLFRCAYKFHKIDGDTNSKKLRNRAIRYQAEKQRLEQGYTHTLLYEQIIDAGEQWMQKVEPSEFIKAKYCNNYVFNDSRLEGVDIDSAKVAEIVTDIRLRGANSPYCTEAHENEIAVAGHARMYEDLFMIKPDDKVDIYTMVRLHKKLFSCAPAPEFGGAFRKSNPLVTGAKFETIDSSEVIPAIMELATTVQNILEHRYEVSPSKYIEQITELHHRLTVIHPFGDGNGRTTRAFLNLLLMRRGLLPIYIKVEEKEQYRDALAKADMGDGLDELYEVVFKAILRAEAELTETALL